MLFSLTHQLDMHVLIAQERRDVVSGDHLHVSKELPLPRGRPFRNAGRRLTGCYENGSDEKKCSFYSC